MMKLDFRSVTDELFSTVSEEELAKVLSCSIAAIRQARLREGAKARRSPPKGWEIALAKLAQQKADRLERLAGKLRAI